MDAYTAGDTRKVSSLLAQRESLLAGRAGHEENEQEQDAMPRARRHTRTSGIGFANLAQTIAKNWRNIDPESREQFEIQAARDKERYKKEKLIWKAKLKTEPDCQQRRQSSPPEHQASITRPLERRASEPLPGATFDFSLDSALDLHRSDFSNWAEPSDGGSLGSLDHGWEDNTLGFEVEAVGRNRPTPRRSYSDSMLHTRDNFYDIRPCEELAADISDDRRTVLEETKDSATISSLRALNDSLDEEMVDFITTLRRADG